MSKRTSVESTSAAKRKAPEGDTSKRKAPEGDTPKRKAPEGGTPNQEFVTMLTQLSEYEKNVAANMFKAKAYKKAAHTVSVVSVLQENG